MRQYYKTFSILILGLMTLSTSQASLNLVAPIDFEKASAISEWLGKGKSLSYSQSTVLEDGVAIGLIDYLKSPTSEWDVVKLVRYHSTLGEAITTPFKNLKLSQRPQSFQKTPLSGNYFLQSKNDPNRKQVISFGPTYFSVLYLEDDKPGKALAKKLRDDVVPYLNEKSVYKGGVLELKEKGVFGYLDGVDNVNHDWNELILKDDLKNDIKNTIEGFLDHYDRTKWKNFGLPQKRGVLLYGEPGTGKSFVGKILVSKILNDSYKSKPTFLFVSARHMYGVHIVRDLFDLARKMSPTLILIEDIDLIAGTGRENFKEVKNELMQQLSGVETLEGVLTLATTNMGVELDPALRRSKRLGFHYYLGYPGFSERVKLFKSFTNGVDVSAIDWVELSEMSDGMSGADIKEIVLAVKEKAVVSKSIQTVGGVSKLVLTRNIFEEAFVDRKATRLTKW